MNAINSDSFVTVFMTILLMFGTKVQIQPKRKGGKIEIEYHDLEDLERIITIMEG